MTVREFSVDERVQIRGAMPGQLQDAIVLRQAKQRVTVRYLDSGETREVSVTRIKQKQTVR